MWPWLQNVPKQYKLRAKIVAISAFIHACLLFCMLFVYRGYYSSFVITLSKKIPDNARVIFLPFHKVAPTVMAAPKQPESAREIAQKKISPSQEKRAEVEPRTEKKESGATQKTTLAIEKKRVKSKKKPVKKQVPKKIVKKETLKKNMQEKMVEEVKPKVEPALIKPARQASPPALLEASPKSDSVVYVGNLERDALILQQEIQAMVEKVWTPPPGIPSDALCQIQITVDWQGVLHDSRIVVSSGMLLYDMTAQEAITTMEFPKIAWGKSITISFNE